LIRKTKIICTVGPSSRSPTTIQELIRAGVDVFRINFSFGDASSHAEEVRVIRKEGERLARAVAILQDLPGPKIRVGRVQNGGADLQKGSQFTLTARQVLGDVKRVHVNYPPLISSLQKGDRVYLVDGTIELKVKEVAGEDAICTVVTGGHLSSGRGINAPGVHIDIKYPTKADLESLSTGLRIGVDFVALSFVRTAADVLKVRKFIADGGGDTPLIIKIEKLEAVRNLSSILAEADGVMVARGDLGVETPLERVPIVQKDIIERCNAAGKPVIVATQMLLSMLKSPFPTRAEVADITAAVLDGADALMLSDETAVGSYPVECVKVLDKVARAVELSTKGHRKVNVPSGRLSVEEAVSHAACKIAASIDASAIAAPTKTGLTAKRASKYRPDAPVIAMCTDSRVARRLAVYWGVTPVVIKEAATTDEMFTIAEEVVKRTGVAKKGDRVVITSGTPGVRGSTDLVKVKAVG
jgi:pyruvate kinase